MKGPACITITINAPVIQNQMPLTEPEISEFSELFSEAVGHQLKLNEFDETTLYASRLEKHQTKYVCKQMLESKEFLAADTHELQEQYATYHSAQRCDELEREHRQTTQNLLHTIFKIVEFLRRRVEHVDWECDLSTTINLISSYVDYLESTPVKVVSQEVTDLMKEELAAHHDQSSELFLRTAFDHIKTQTDGCDNPMIPWAGKCAETFNQLREVFETVINPIENYQKIALLTKNFGQAFMIYKMIGSYATNAQLAPYAQAIPRKVEPESSIWNYCTIS